MISPASYSRTPVIAAIGATEYSKDARRSELTLAIEAIAACLDQAGFAADQVDGLTTFTMDLAPELDIQAGLGLGEMRFLSRVPFGGGGGCATIQMAAMAVQCGYANAVVAYRAVRTSSGERFGGGAITAPPEIGNFEEYSAFGVVTPASRAALTAARYLHRYGLKQEAFASVAMNARSYAATNPAAHYYRRPLTLDEYMNSPWISWPLRKVDCCQESDGAVAVLITTVDRARDLRTQPVYIRAAAQSAGTGQRMLVQYWSDDILKLPEIPGLKAQLERQSGIKVQDVDAAMLYDHFSPLVLLQLEQLGFCDDGGGAEFISSGHTRQDGRLPLNTHGGHMGEAYIHGMNGVAEAVRQLRGEAVNQVAKPTNILVTSAASSPSSALILGTE
jgi:acetyl-CoA acetyltransferase